MQTHIPFRDQSFDRENQYSVTLLAYMGGKKWGLRKDAWTRPCCIIMIWLVFIPTSGDTAGISGGSWKHCHNCSSGKTVRLNVSPSCCCFLSLLLKIPKKLPTSVEHIRQPLTHDVGHGENKRKLIPVCCVALLQSHWNFSLISHDVELYLKLVR